MEIDLVKNLVICLYLIGIGYYIGWNNRDN